MKPFVDYGHQNLFRVIRGQLPEEGRHDPGVLSLVYLMAGSEALRTLVSPYFDVDTGRFDYQRVLEQSNVPQELNVLLRLAVELHSGETGVSVKDLVEGLEEPHFSLALLAIRLRKQGIQSDLYNIGNHDMMIT
ncbi:hypothetical protein ACTHQ2_22675 [Bacillus subtilis]|uniref:hypothetical protein n=1 Tax=Bacillus subtilis TaxID=1423 RepID=UPI003F7BF319